MNNGINSEIGEQFRALLAAATRMTTDLGAELSTMLEEGARTPLDPDHAERLLGRIIDGISKSRGNHTSESNPHVTALLAMAMTAREHVRALLGPAPVQMKKRQTVFLIPEHNGVEAGTVVPRPVFHEKEVAMVGGFIRTNDINLWNENERLEIHVAQFRAKNGRPPTAGELFEIMAGKMPLDGTGDDEFEIKALARSIAANGVRKPPIIDIDGALLDGNRRVAACMMILNDTSDEFSAEDKKRAGHIFVWQLTPHADADDRDRVIVSLNFESDQKKEWPEYIKARKVWEEWEAILALEPTKPNAKRQAEMKKALSRKYALGPDTNVVNRYLKMIRWANEFEEHHINVRKRDEFTVQHAANRYFQYFDELGKGEGSGGVAYALNQDERFKQTVFDLLFDGKFESWKQIRALKHIHGTEEAREQLAKAHVEPDLELAQEHVETAITIANSKRADQRSMGANQRIEIFTKWLDEVPPRTLRDDVKLENLLALQRALKTVDGPVREGLAAKGVNAP
jgi:hypothetical protein